MKKKMTSIVFILVLCVLVLCAFVGCKKKHSHDYGEWTVTIESTCEKEGERIRSCSGCVILEIETIPALGHTYGELVAEKPATCTEEGVKAHYECSVCHKYFDIDKNEIDDLTISALGHTYGEWIDEIKATCTEDGIKAHYECSACHKYFDSGKNVIEDLTIESLGHTYGEWIDEVKATCTEDGIKAHYECSVCHKYFDSGKNVIEDLTIELLGHTYGEWIDEVKATCTEDGTKAHYECSVCHKYFDSGNNEIDDLTISALGHTYGEWIGEVKATCTEEGTKGHYECSVCHKYFDSEKNVIEDLTIKSFGHTYGEWIDEIKATCTEDGIKAHYECSACHKYFDSGKNEIEDLTIESLGHSYSKWIDEIKATCTEEGIKAHYECSACHKYFDSGKNVIEDLTIESLGHSYSKWIDEVKATCTEDGTKGYYECSACHKYFDSEKNVTEDLTIKSLGHTYSEWIDEVPATCMVNGVKAHKTCTRCNENFDVNNKKITDLVIKASHTLGDYTNEIFATCTTDGRIAYSYCSVCDKTFDIFGNEKSASELIIQAKGHDFGKWIKEFSATCSEAGVIGHYHCDRCNKDFDAENHEIANTLVPPYGHIYTTLTIIPQLDPKCDEEGYIAHFECGKCGAYADENGVVIASITLKATGHSYDHSVRYVEPTCTKPGMDSYDVCSICSKYFKDSDYYTTLTEDDLVLPALGHRYIHKDQVEATCMGNGAKEHYHCDRCNTFFDNKKVEVVSDTLIVPRLAHVYGELINEIPATETENGCISHYECKVCGHCVDEKYDEVTTAILPKLEHYFSDWYDKNDESCYSSGTLGHYYCYNCEKYFDKDYNEIEDIEIPPHHKFGELIEAKQGICNEPSILVSYYECSVCGYMVDEQYNEINYEDVFDDYYRHNWEYSLFNEWEHKQVCKDCGERQIGSHESIKVFYVEKGIHMFKYVCKDCGYEDESFIYDQIVETRVMSDYYVGYTSEDSYILEVIYENGHYSYWSLSSFIDNYTLSNIFDMLSSLPEDFTPFVKTFLLEENGYEESVSITFRPLVINAVKTEFEYYQTGKISDIGDVEFILDCNYTDDLGEVIGINGNVTDLGDFDPNYDFEATGEISKVFTIKYEYDGKNYDVNITLITDTRPREIKINNNEIMQDESFFFNIIYTDNSSREYELTDADIIEGTFDSSVLGKQTFTICKDGLIKKVSLEVIDPYGIRYYNVSKRDIFIGESILLDVICNNNEHRSVTVTPEMIIGDFDNMTVGSYEITILLGGRYFDENITVIDPDDYRIERIFVKDVSSVVWDIVDGAVVPNYYNLQLIIVKYNGTSESIMITEDMVSYNQSDVDKAIANGGSFIVVVTYYGKTTNLKVYPHDLQTYMSRSFYITKLSTGGYGSYSYIYTKNGDLSDYCVIISYSDGNRYIPLTKDMFFTDQNGTTLFDFNTMENKKKYTTYVHCYDKNTRVYIMAYTENDVRYYVTNNLQFTATVGTRESVLDQMNDHRWSLFSELDYISSWICDFGIDEVLLDESENLDFSKTGNIELKASYNGVIFTIYIKLMESLEGIEKTTYKFEDQDFVLYANGIVYVTYYSEWGTVVCINQELGLYRALIDHYEPMIFKIKGNVVSKFYAEMLGGIQEIYTFDSLNETISYKVYTKNSFSLVDMYDEYDNLISTNVVEFSLDGKYIYIDNVRYTIRADNKLELEEGNIV